MLDTNYCMVDGFPQGTFSGPRLTRCSVLFDSNLGQARPVLGSMSWFGVGPLFMGYTIAPHNPIFRPWGWDHGHAFGTWGIVPKVIAAFRRHQSSGNKCFEFDSLHTKHAQRQLSRSMAKIAWPFQREYFTCPFNFWCFFSFSINSKIHLILHYAKVSSFDESVIYILLKTET